MPSLTLPIQEPRFAQAQAPTLPAHGVTVYATLYSKIDGVWLSNSYVYTESGSPTLAALTTPTPGLSTVLGTTNVLFQWAAGTSASDYQLNLSATTPGASDLFSYKGTALSAKAPTLPANGVKVYARLYSNIDGVWLYNDYAYTEQYAQPSVTSVSLSTINAGSPDTEITLQGSNFTPASIVRSNGNSLSTSYVSGSKLQATISASTLALAGSLCLSVSNPSPGGGSSSTLSITVLPQLKAITPASAPVGGNVTLQLTGVNSTNISTVVVSFIQTGNTYGASNGALTSSNGTEQLSIAVPFGLVPASAAAWSSAPAQISASVNSIAAPSNLPFTVLPPTHAGVMSPAIVQTGLSVSASFIGIATAFDETTTIASDDPDITFNGISASSSTLLLATMQIGSGAGLGAHTITMTAQGQAFSYLLEVVAATTSPAISSVTPAASAPAAPITIIGTGFGNSAGTAVTLSFTYSGMEADTPATTVSSTEIDSYMPVLTDPVSGGLYVGPVLLEIVANGQPSSSFPITLSALPANASAIGSTTLASIDALIANATNVQSQLSSSSLMTPDQAQSNTAFYASMLANLRSLRVNVVAAAGGATVTNPDGTTYDASGIDQLDRLLQSATPPGSTTPFMSGHSVVGGGVLQTQSNSEFSDTLYSGAGGACFIATAPKAVLQFAAIAAIGACLATLKLPQAAPLCGALTELALNSSILPAVGGIVCDALPINLVAVYPSPPSIYFGVDGPSVVEAPSGLFQTSPKLSGNESFPIQE